ncbi:MAG: phosphoenolpyruvate synthase, partial [Acidimicrobiia bacterium]|nr:phosphoenolpyruvate synthase [Acidimicrobiia bacterium]
MTDTIRWFRSVGMDDVGEVGGKNASLGEMLSNLSDLGVTVPDGFATTATAFRDYLAATGLDERIAARVADLDVEDVGALGAAGHEIRSWITSTPLPDDLAIAIAESYEEMGSAVSVAVRSSATAEDLPDASFAGQQETFLNVRGSKAVLARVLEVFASLYNDRAIAYRVHRGFSEMPVAISAGVQRMVKSVASGVAFTVDTESGFSDVVFITSAFGLGELLVQGAVNPDEFYVHKKNLREGRPSILSRSLGLKQQRMTYADTDSGEDVTTEEVPDEERATFSLATGEIEELARYGLILEDHYGRPMDIEWGKDADDGKIYILQARPETVQSQSSGRTLERFS